MKPRARKEKSVSIDELSRYFRVPARGLAVDYPGRDLLLKSRITNVSHSGVFIATDSPFPAGKKLRVSFRLPNCQRTLQVECVVRWSSANAVRGTPFGRAKGMGLEFTKIARRDQKLIAEYIKDFLQRMRRGG